MRFRSPLVAALLGTLLAPGLAAAGTGVLYERALLAEADRRCRLFDPAVSAALLAGVAQARGAALRTEPPQAVRTAEGRALAKAARTPCASPELQTAAARVRYAYAGWSRMRSMSFPGTTASWRADRTVSPEPRWRLLQSSRLGDGEVLFGLAASAGEPPRLTAVARLRERPAYVRLRLPDGRAFIAGGRQPAAKPLRPRGWGEPLAYRFPHAAAQALAGLDRGATVRLEFVSPTRKGEKARTAAIEVGDFAAGQAFLALGGPAA